VVGFLLLLEIEVLVFEVLVFEPVPDLTEVVLPPVPTGMGIFETALAADPFSVGALATNWGEHTVGARA